ncbi:uridine phosphorylase [Carboxydochorda subterranea]|uniref:Uridine phosphorylase n=1 Tax=Carboxydichorda subterranea TaxID=3109565 RepID=A0ABZ1BY98_9FIRM|nr:uridine phosphorylase [Limnochorda sp. L945t]WRP17786.1 uridine phosphorylase [Limnochorda sp. L945t]
MESWHSGASRPQSGGVPYHIRCAPGEVARYVLLPGDPERVPLIARFWDERREVARHREYTTYTGRVGGVPISSTSTGIGGSSTAIAIEELAEIGADTFIRVGTCGAIQPEIACGDLVIVSAAVRLDGASADYVDLAYPAASHYQVTAALVEAAQRLGMRYHVGVSASTATFHLGQSRPGFGGYSQSGAERRIEDLRRARVQVFEMEAATIYTLASLFGLRSGGVMAVVANRVTDEMTYGGIEEAARTASEAVRILAEWDARMKRSGSRYWYPSVG